MAAGAKAVMAGDGRQETRSAEDEIEPKGKYEKKRQRSSSRSRRRRAESKSKMTLSCQQSPVAITPLTEEQTARTLDANRPQTAPPSSQGKESSRRTTIQRFVRSCARSPPVTATPIDRNQSDGDGGCNEGYREKNSKEKRGHVASERGTSGEGEMEHPVADEKKGASDSVEGQQQNGATFREVSGKVNGGFVGIVGRHFSYLIMASKRVLSGNRSRQKSSAQEETRRAPEVLEEEPERSDTNVKLDTQHDQANNVRQQKQPQSPSPAETMESSRTEEVDSSEEEASTPQRTRDRHGDSGQGDVVKQVVRRGVSGPVSVSPSYHCGAGQKNHPLQAVRSVVYRNVSTPAVRRAMTLPKDQYGNQRTNGDCRTCACSDDASDARSKNSSPSTEDDMVKARDEWRSEDGSLEAMHQGDSVDAGAFDEESEVGSETSVTSKRRTTHDIAEVDDPERGGDTYARPHVLIDEDNADVLIRLTSYRQLRNSTRQQGKSMSNMKIQKSYKCADDSESPPSDRGGLMETKSSAECGRMRSKHSSEANVRYPKDPESKMSLKTINRNSLDQNIKMIHASPSTRMEREVLSRKPEVSTKNASVSTTDRRGVFPNDRLRARNMLIEREKTNGGQENQDCSCNDQDSCSSQGQSFVCRDDRVEYEEENPQHYEELRTIVEDSDDRRGVGGYRDEWLDHAERQINGHQSAGTCSICREIGIESPCGHVEETEKTPLLKRTRENYPAQYRTVGVDPKSEREKRKIIKSPSMSPITSSNETSPRRKSEHYVPQQCDRSKRQVASGKVMNIFQHPAVSVDPPSIGFTPQSDAAALSDLLDKTKRAFIPSTSYRSKQTSSVERIVRRPSYTTTATQYTEDGSPAPSKCGVNIKTQVCSFQMPLSSQDSFQIPRSPKGTDLRPLISLSSGSDVSNKSTAEAEDTAALNGGSVSDAARRPVLVSKDIERLVSESHWRNQSASNSTVESSTSLPATDATVLERESGASKEGKPPLSTVQSRGSSEGNRALTSEASAATSHGSIISEDMEYEYDAATNTIMQKASPPTSPATETSEVPSDSPKTVRCRCIYNDNSRRKTTRDSSCGPRSERGGDGGVRAAVGTRDCGCGPDRSAIGDNGETSRRRRHIIRPSRCPRSELAMMERLMEMAAFPTRKKVTVVCCQTSNHSLPDRSKSPQGGRNKKRRDEVEKLKVIDENPTSVGKMWISPIDSTEHRIQEQQVYSARIEAPPSGRNTCFADDSENEEEDEEEVFEFSPIQIVANNYAHITKPVDEACDDVIYPFSCTDSSHKEEDSVSWRSDPAAPWAPPSAGLAEDDESIEELVYEKEAPTVDPEDSIALSFGSAEPTRNLRREDQSSRLIQTISPDPSVAPPEIEEKCPHSSLCTMEMLPRCHCKERHLAETRMSTTTQEEQFISAQTLDRESLATRSSTQEQRCASPSKDPVCKGVEYTCHAPGAGEEAAHRCCSKPFRFVKLRTCAGLTQGDDATEMEGCGCQVGGVCTCCACEKPSKAAAPELENKDTEPIPLICNASGRTVVVGYLRLPLRSCLLFRNHLTSSLSRVDEFTDYSQASRDQCSQTESKMAEETTSRSSDVDVTKSLTPEGMESIRSGRRCVCSRNSRGTRSSTPSGEKRFRGAKWGAIGEGDNVTCFSSSVRVKTVRGKRTAAGGAGRGTVRNEDGDSVASYMAASLGGRASGNAAMRRCGCGASCPVVAVRGGGGGGRSGSSCGSSTSPSRSDDVTAAASSSAVEYPACVRKLPRYLVLGEGERLPPNKVSEFEVTNEPAPKKTSSKQNTQKTSKGTTGGKNIPLKKAACNANSGIESSGAEKDNPQPRCTVTKSAAIFNFTECETTFLQNIRCDDLLPTGQVACD